MPYITPDPDANAAVAVSITVPAVFVSAVLGALRELIYSNNWEEYGAITVDEAVLAMTFAYNRIKTGNAQLEGALVSAWALDEPSGIRHDSHGDKHLTDNNTVGSGTPKLGAYSANFIRANTEYLSHVDDSDFDFTRDDFTLAFFVNLNDKTTTQRLITKINTNFEMQVAYSVGLDRYLLQASTNGTTATQTATASSYGSPTAGAWQFIIAQRNAATDMLGIQVNNGTLNEASLPSDIYDGTGIFTLGGNSAPLGGYLDMVYYWRKILTATQKTWLYNSGNGRSYLEVLAYQG